MNACISMHLLSLFSVCIRLKWYRMNKYETEANAIGEVDTYLFQPPIFIFLQLLYNNKHVFYEIKYFDIIPTILNRNFRRKQRERNS